MKKALASLLTIFASLTIFGQTFEGAIIYQNTYTSKLANLTDQQLLSMLGLKQDYYIKRETTNLLRMGHLLSGNFILMLTIKFITNYQTLKQFYGMIEV